jgi:hypothetical protein
LSNSKGFTRIAAVLLVLVLCAAAYFIYIYPRAPPSPAALSFSFSLPKVISAGQTVDTQVTVVNNGTDANEVAVVVISDAVTCVSESSKVNKGSQAALKISITGKDIPDGLYPVKVYLQYSDELGTHSTATKETSIRLMPNIELVDVRFQPDLFHPFGKNTMGKKDTTNLLFKVHSRSNAVVYSGIQSRMVLSISVTGISTSPSTVQVERIGPNGRTGDYGFTITSDDAPPGTYNLTIGLYSKDNQLIMQQSVQLIVTG